MTEAANPFRLTAEDERVLALVLDEIIPPSEDGRFPGAGELGLSRAIVAAAADNSALGPTVARGLGALDELARARHDSGFPAVGREERAALLRELAASDAGFVPSLAFPTYVAYYQHPRVMEALGREARPPHPKGYEMEPFDLSLLEPVRRRRKLYRDV